MLLFFQEEVQRLQSETNSGSSLESGGSSGYMSPHCLLRSAHYNSFFWGFFVENKILRNLKNSRNVHYGLFIKI